MFFSIQTYVNIITNLREINVKIKTGDEVNDLFLTSNLAGEMLGPEIGLGCPVVKTLNLQSIDSGFSPRCCGYIDNNNDIIFYLNTNKSGVVVAFMGVYNVTMSTNSYTLLR